MTKVEYIVHSPDFDLDTLIPSFSIDCVIFSFHKGAIKVLLSKMAPGLPWALPEGFVRKHEDIDSAASRILYSRTGIENVFLKQFYLFGGVDRIDPDQNKKFADEFGIKESKQQWFLQRFVTLAYYALIKHDEYKIESKILENECIEWFDLKEIPKLYGDHNQIINKAIQTIRSQIGFIPIGYQLLPEKFTIPELRVIYESILGKELDRRNFQRKILSVGYIKKLDEKRRNGAHKAPQLYSFNKELYEKANEYGLQLMPWSLRESSL